jgi:hypothetical protein
MADIHDFSARVIDYAERLSAIADAAQGKRRGIGGLTRWMVLPVSGAALYAFARSDFFARQAKVVIDDAKTLAADLPDDLIGAVRQTTGGDAKSNGSRGGSTSRTTGSRKTTTRRKSSSGSRTAQSRTSRSR